MALYCSREIFQALDGMHFPATKEDLLDYAEFKDAREAVVVVLNELNEGAIFHDVSEVCENARIACNLQVVRVLQQAPFPAKREDLIGFAVNENAPDSVKSALERLPSEYTFGSLDDVCDYIL